MNPVPKPLVLFVGSALLYSLAADVLQLVAQDFPQSGNVAGDSFVDEWEKIHALAGPNVLFMIQFASDLPDEDEDRWRNVVNRLQEDALQSEMEFAITVHIFDPVPDSLYDSVAEPSGDRAIDDLLAAVRSYARYEGARIEGDDAWAKKQRDRARDLTREAAAKIESSARANVSVATRLASESFAIRRPSQEALIYHQALIDSGFSLAQRQHLLAAGYTEKEMAAYLEELRTTPPGEIGISIVEFYRAIGERRRVLAEALAEHAADGVLESPGPMVSAFTLGNPHDNEETINLVIQRATLPPAWQLSIIAIDSVGSEEREVRVYEDEPGGQYHVTLPEGEQIRLATILETVGTVGEGTTARWSVEGWIGDELLGGIVQELVVPASALAAQEAGSPEVAAESGFLSWKAFAVGAALLVLLLAAIWLNARRRKQG